MKFEKQEQSKTLTQVKWSVPHVDVGLKLCLGHVVLQFRVVDVEGSQGDTLGAAAYQQWPLRGECVHNHTPAICNHYRPCRTHHHSVAAFAESQPTCHWPQHHPCVMAFVDHSISGRETTKAVKSNIRGADTRSHNSCLKKINK